LEAAADSPWGMAGFVTVYVLLVVSFAPGTIGTITSAAIFGFSTGFALSMVGASIGATLVFIIGRALGRNGAQRLLGRRLRSVDELLGDRDFLSVLILRLLPIVPFNGLNYAASFSSVRLWAYVAATVVGIAPGTALTSFTVSRADEPGSRGFLIGLALSGLAVVVSVLIARRVTTEPMATNPAGVEGGVAEPGASRPERSSRTEAADA